MAQKDWRTIRAQYILSNGLQNSFEFYQYTHPSYVNYLVVSFQVFIKNSAKKQFSTDRPLLLP